MILQPHVKKTQTAQLITIVAQTLKNALPNAIVLDLMAKQILLALLESYVARVIVMMPQTLVVIVPLAYPVMLLLYVVLQSRDQSVYPLKNAKLKMIVKKTVLLLV